MTQRAICAAEVGQLGASAEQVFPEHRRVLLALGGLHGEPRVGERRERRPRLARRAADGEDALQLRQLRRTAAAHELGGDVEKRLQEEHLGDNAPRAPHVDRGAVRGGPEQQLWRAIPQRDDALRQGPA